MHRLLYVVIPRKRKLLLGASSDVPKRRVFISDRSWCGYGTVRSKSVLHSQRKNMVKARKRFRLFYLFAGEKEESLVTTVFLLFHPFFVCFSF